MHLHDIEVRLYKGLGSDRVQRPMCTPSSCSDNFAVLHVRCRNELDMAREAEMHGGPSLHPPQPQDSDDSQQSHASQLANGTQQSPDSQQKRLRRPAHDVSDIPQEIKLLILSFLCIEVLESKIGADGDSVLFPLLTLAERARHSLGHSDPRLLAFGYTNPDELRTSMSRLYEVWRWIRGVDGAKGYSDAAWLAAFKAHFASSRSPSKFAVFTDGPLATSCSVVVTAIQNIRALENALARFEPPILTMPNPQDARPLINCTSLTLDARSVYLGPSWIFDTPSTSSLSEPLPDSSLAFLRTVFRHMFNISELQVVGSKNASVLACMHACGSIREAAFSRLAESRSLTQTTVQACPHHTTHRRNHLCDLCAVEFAAPVDSSYVLTSAPYCICGRNVEHTPGDVRSPPASKAGSQNGRDTKWRPSPLLARRASISDQRDAVTLAERVADKNGVNRVLYLFAYGRESIDDRHAVTGPAGAQSVTIDLATALRSKGETARHNTKGRQTNDWLPIIAP